MPRTLSCVTWARIRHVDGAPRSHSSMRRSGLQERIRIVPGGQTVEEGTAAACLLLDDGPLPTAIVAYDDDCAAGLWEALTRAGVSVPGDISIVGYDDSRQSRLAL